MPRTGTRPTTDRVRESLFNVLAARIEFTGVDRVIAVRGSEDPIQGWHCPDFGESEPATALVASVDSLSPVHALGYTIHWS